MPGLRNHALKEFSATVPNTRPNNVQLMRRIGVRHQALPGRADRLYVGGAAVVAVENEGAGRGRYGDRGQTAARRHGDGR